MAAPPLTLSFIVVGVAQPQGSTRAFMRPGMQFPVVTHDNPRLHQWRDLVATTVSRTMEEHLIPLFLGPVALRVVFALPRPQSLPRRVVTHLKAPDLDKLLRAIGDALTGVVYRDDAQIVELVGRKLYAPLGVPPTATITVSAAATIRDPEPLSLFEEAL
jgi:crossover junction endodeoxyribonuclease RusA